MFWFVDNSTEAYDHAPIVFTLLSSYIESFSVRRRWKQTVMPPRSECLWSSANGSIRIDHDYYCQYRSAAARKFSRSLNATVYTASYLRQRRRKMRHRNPRGGQKYRRKLGETKFSWCLCIKCSKTHLPAALIPNFSRGQYPRTPIKNGERERGRREGKGGEVALWLLGGNGRLCFALLPHRVQCCNSALCYSLHCSLAYSMQ